MESFGIDQCKLKCLFFNCKKGPRIQYTVCDLCGKKYRRKMDMLQHKKDDHMYITKEEVAALERLKFLYDKKGNNSQQAITSQVNGILFMTSYIRVEVRL